MKRRTKKKRTARLKRAVLHTKRIADKVLSSVRGNLDRVLMHELDRAIRKEKKANRGRLAP